MTISPPTPYATLATVEQLKSANQDFEFYPTTAEQLQIINGDIQTILKTHEFSHSYDQKIRVLDIGSGDGRSLNSIAESLEAINSDRIRVTKLAIEKSTLHIGSYRKQSINLVGTDFFETNLISKNTDVAFCNPPFSQFSSFIQTIISQLNFKLFYAILPSRWIDDPQIAECIEKRGVSDVEVIAQSDFLGADRQARAKVDLVRFSFNDFEKEAELWTNTSRYRSRFTIGRDSSCAFQQFIENELGLRKSYSSTTQKFNEHIERERVRTQMATEGTHCHDVAVSRGVLWALLDNYEQDLSKTLNEYKKISELDTALLQELGVDYESVRTGVKEKLFGYRNVYWNLLFEHLDALSSRLTKRNKETLLNTLKSNALDFTYTNATYVVSFAVEMANELIESSMIEVYQSLTSEKSILRHFKSNTHMFNDRWRHNRNDDNSKAKYILDYRFVSTHHSNFSSYNHTLNDSARDFTNDLMVVFRLLGYSHIIPAVELNTIEAGNSLLVRGNEPSGKRVDLVKIRYYKNGNRHISFNQEAMLRFNVTVSRLLGWVRSKDDFDAEAQSSAPTRDDIWAVSDGLKVSASSVALALTHQQAA